MSRFNGDDAPQRIEDYAMIADGCSAALVGRNGSIDWLCWPNFDSDACFAALLGTARHGCWRIAPTQAATSTRRYVGDTLLIETLFESDEGAVAVVDFMAVEAGAPTLIRRVEGRRGSVEMDMHMAPRFEYGSVTPWFMPLESGQGLQAVGGPNRLVLRTGLELSCEDGVASARFTLKRGETQTFALDWSRSNRPAPAGLDLAEAERSTEAYWREWAGRCEYQGAHREAVLRSLLTLKALMFKPTGAVVAAPTTSLPEQLGGQRNWDYRICWLRDATLTLIAIMAGGYVEEAAAWRAWLHRAVAGDPDEVQTMYGLSGERRLTEWTVDWLPGYENAHPVRVGNAASSQLQLDTFGELMGVLRIGRLHGFSGEEPAWPLQLRFMEHLETIWEQPDNGIWEVRGERRHFTHSKVMSWFAVDCSIRDAEAYGFDAPLERWRALRARMHAEICEKGYDAGRNTFTRSFGDTAVDASLLLIPQVGFLPFDDPRILGTVKAIEADLIHDGFVLRYRTEGSDDGLPAGEGAFLPCSFWLAGVYSQQGRREEATALFERILGVANDVGLLSEEYDAKAGRLVGNFPQAYSHLALVAAALALEGISMARVQLK